MARFAAQASLLTLFVLELFLGRLFAESAKPTWLVVSAPAYKQALEPLCQHREKQGYRVVKLITTEVLTPKQILAGEAEPLCAKVQALCKEQPGQCMVLLVGACHAKGLTEPESKVLPIPLGSSGRMKGQPADNAFGCLDGKLLPTIAVGRLPARSEQEANDMIRKILAFEQDNKPGAWRRQITVLAGVPAFNPLVDRLVERAALAKLEKIQPIWSGRAVYHNAQSRFCVPDPLLHDQSLHYVQQGQAFTLYLGHSGVEGFYAGSAKFLDRDDWAKLKIPQGPGVFATFGCLGCQLSGKEGEGYGLAAIRNPHGPVAVTGSHGICFAAMVQLASQGMFEAFQNELPDRLGDVWLAMKKHLAEGAIDAFTYKMLDSADGDPKIPQAAQRLEHLEMFLLLGDPALQLPRVGPLLKTVVSQAVPGEKVQVQVHLPEKLRQATVLVQLERTLASDPEGLLPLPKEPGQKRDQAMFKNHLEANRFTLQSAKKQATGAVCEFEFVLPKEMPWPQLLVRVYAVQEQAEGFGASKVQIAEVVGK